MDKISRLELFRVIHGHISMISGLIHESRGEGKDRKLVLEKKNFKQKTSSETPNENSDFKPVPNDKPKTSEDENSNDKLCDNCEKRIPLTNFQLHELRCSANRV